MPGEKLVQCRFCGDKTTPKLLRRHWRGFCEKLPQLEVDERLCSTCQSPKSIERDFSVKARSFDGLNNDCKQCSLDRFHQWRKDNPNIDRRDFERINVRPGKWKLQQCRYCIKKFTKEAMLLHLRECPNNPRAKLAPGSQNIPDMEAILERYRSMTDDDRQKSRNLAMVYDIRIEDYDRMLSAQNGVCAICKLPPSGKRKSRTINLAVDHCHATGKIRALLCSHCNAGIGGFKDNRSLLLAAIDYLDAHIESVSHVSPVPTELTAGL